VVSVFDWLVELVSGSPVAYLAVLAGVALDAVVPTVPSETLLITGGLLAARAELSLPAVIAAGWAGAVVGDSAAYALGAGPGRRAALRVARRPRDRARLAGLQGGLEHRPWLLAVANFVPGLRPLAMLAAGSVHLPLPRFYAAVVPGGLVWSAFTTLLGYGGGRLVAESPWLSLAASLAVGGALGLGVEGVRRRRGQPAPQQRR
jgi:membrane protein DedA with SNARE-associated domain